MGDAVEIDGSRGEGGGQILRTSLALAVLTRRPLRMRKIRAGRARPGLQRQHLACVEAAAQLCGAELSGAELGSQKLDFTPGDKLADELTIDIGTAGSTTLVVQTILIPAIAARHTLHATITGGTHNPLAPPFEFLDRVFLPHLRSMGASVQLQLSRVGVVPSGGGRIELDVARAGPLRPIALVEAGPVIAKRACAIVARLPTHVAERELAVVRARLGVAEDDCEVRDVRGGPANVLMIEAERATSRELVTGHGEKGARAELVAERACDELAAYLASDVPVGEHLADQLLLPMAIAGAGRFRFAGELSLHATTNIDTIRAFVDIAIHVERDEVIIGAE